MLVSGDLADRLRGVLRGLHRRRDGLLGGRWSGRGRARSHGREDEGEGGLHQGKQCVKEEERKEPIFKFNIIQHYTTLYLRTYTVLQYA